MKKKGVRKRDKGERTLIIMLELAIDGLAVFLFLEGLALVVAVFASCKADVKLGASVFVDKKKCGNNGGAGALCRML